MSTAPPLTDQERTRLTTLWNNGNYFGRSKLFHLLRQDPDNTISRRQVSDWLAQNELAQTFRRPLRRTGVQAIVSTKLGSWQCDEMDMTAQAFKGFNTIFSITDLFSKKLFAVPLKAKSSGAATYAIQHIMRNNPNTRFRTVTTDGGSEFKTTFHEFLEEKGIRHLVTRPSQPWSNGQIERSNATLRKQISMHMAVHKTKDWPSALDKLVEAINNSVSASTGKTPNEIEMAEQHSETHLAAAAKIRGRAARSAQARGATTLKVGDTVRKVLAYDASGIRKPSRDGYFGPAKYQIYAVVPSRYANQLPSYKIASNGHVLSGLYGRWQLLHIPNANQGLSRRPQVADNQNEEEEEEEEEENTPRRSLRQEGVYEVDYIHGKRRRKNIIQYLVRWVGYPESESTYEPVSNLKNARQAIQEYESRTHH